MKSKSTLKIDTRVRSLRKYLEEFEQGVFQVPSFQRDFVWEVPAIIQLFDSIKNKYPIGSIQFWQPKEEAEIWLSEDVQIGPYKLTNPTQVPKPIYILDGLQRLSSLFGSLVNPERIDTKRFELDEELRKEKFRIYYDLDTEEFFALKKNQKKTLNHQVPLYALINTSDFRKFSREVLEKVEDKVKLEQYLDRADKLSNTISDYEIASVDILEASVEEAVEIFWRVNAKGQPISKDWIVNALSNRSDFRLSNEIEDLLGRLKKYNFSEDKRELLINCIFSSFGKFYYDQDSTKLVKESVNEFIKVTRKTIINIEKAVKFLFERCFVLDSKTLPSQFPLIFITQFYNLIEKPNNSQEDEIEKWFWYTTYSNYFTIYNAPSKIRKIFELFRLNLNEDISEIIYNEIDNDSKKLISPKYKLSHFGSVRFCANVLYQLKNANEKIDVDTCLGFESIKLIETENTSLGNMIYKPILVNDPVLNYDNKKHNSLEFLLLDAFRGKHKELFITDDMRDLYAEGKYSEVISKRESLIIESENEFIQFLNLDLE